MAEQPSIAQITFTEVAESAGVADTGTGRGTAWGDYDNDGYLDLYLANKDEANRLYENQRDGTFAEVASTAGVDDSGLGHGASWGDFDNDGDLDLYLANWRTNRLYKNGGDGTFTETGADDWVNNFRESHGASWGDYNNDGHLDLYVINTAAVNRLYRNNGDETFTDFGGIAGVDNGGQADFSDGVSWGDYDSDGDLDLYVINDRDVNWLYQNEGDETFSEVGAIAGVDDSGPGRGVSWGDYDNDSHLDLFFVNGRSDQLFLYKNGGDGRFARVETSDWVGDTLGESGSWGDYDNDGDLDLFLNRLYQNNGDGTFVKLDENAGVDHEGSGFGISWGDYDSDGDLDLYLASQSANLLYRNNGNSNRWLEVRLGGSASNRSGIGAQVTAVTGTLRQQRDVDGGSGYGSQPSLPVEFGLGSTNTVDSLIVRWPSGQTQVLTGVATNQILSVTEPELAIDESQVVVNSTTDAADFGGSLKVRNLPGPDGVVSLREAIVASNNTSGPQLIQFNISTSDDGFNGDVFTIQPLSALPALTDNGITIDGVSQTLFSGDSNPDGPEIVLDGSSVDDGTGVDIASNEHIVRGLVIHSFATCLQAGHEGDSNITVTRCYIGTDETGAIPKRQSQGISVSGSNVVIGGEDPSDGNLVSGSSDFEINIGDAESRDVVIEGNRIGTDRTGRVALGQGHGIYTFGSDALIKRNLISGNGTAIRLLGDDSGGNRIEQNLIGTDSTGAGPLPNNVGIYIHTPTGNTVEANVIAFTRESGIIVSDGARNRITGNSIHSNDGLGIDLFGAGVNPNDAGDFDTGPNELMNYPVLTSAFLRSGQLEVVGAIDTADPEAATIEFFANPVPTPGGDPSGYGEGADFLGSVQPNVEGSFTALLPAVPEGTPVSATAIDAIGNTSEFAMNVEARAPPGDIVVNSTLDQADIAGAQQLDDLPGADGLVTLREAIMAANNTAGPQVIAFNIPTTDSGYDGATFTIRPSFELWALTDDGTTIDGSTQTAFTGDSNAAGPEIVINGAVVGNGTGLTILSGNNVIHSLVINGFGQNGININFSSGNTVTGCFIGIDANGNVSASNGMWGIFLTQTESNRIGGPTPEERNVISANQHNGIRILNSSGNLIQNNYIGTDASGTKPLGNVRWGIVVEKSSGGETENTRIIGNLISSNDLGGIFVRSGNTQILGNRIGADADGNWVLGNNGADGIHVNAGIFTNPNLTGITIGGLGVDEGNLIVDNRAAGIRLQKCEGALIRGNVISGNLEGGVLLTVAGTTLSVNNTISQNLIFGHTTAQTSALGIDIGQNGVNPNDPGDLDSGLNEQMNFPVLDSALLSSGQLQVSGTLDTPDPETATIELFANPVPDPGGNLTGYGEGAEYIGEAIPSSDGSFDATFSAVDEGTLISATATDAAGNTSEFALNIAAEGPEPAPTIPALLVPEQGAIDQSTELTLQWGAAENSQNYRVQVDDDIDFSSPLVDETLPPEPEPNLAVSSLTVATTYYWRVRAANAGGESDWSAPGSFTTVPAPPAIAPTLVSPAQGSSLNYS